MSVPPTANPVFNADDFLVQTSSGGLDETTANARYIRKTVDDSTDYSLTVRNGFWTQSVDAPPDSNSISLGYNADSITVGGSLTSSGLIYANGNLSMGSALINLGAPSGLRATQCISAFIRETFLLRLYPLTPLGKTLRFTAANTLWVCGWSAFSFNSPLMRPCQTLRFSSALHSRERNTGMSHS